VASSGDNESAEFPERLAALDTLLDHRVRLAICVLLSRYDRLSFSRLKELTAETDGSLGAHLRRLEEAGHVRVKKEFVGRKPMSWYALTPPGLTALAGHLDALTHLLSAAGDRPGE